MAFSILIVTFLVAFFQVNAGDQCDNNNSTQCLCLYADDYEYQCPPLNTNILIRTMPEDYLNIDCYDMETFDVHLFPNYRCGNTGTIRIKFCPLPEDNFLSLFDKFNIKNVKELHLDNVSLSEYSSSDAVSKNIFYGLNNLEILTLSHMNNLLDDDLLVYVPKLTQFYLENSEIANLDNFKLPSSIKVLHIIGNPLTEVPQGIFQNLTQLKQLHLWRNQITSIKRSDFSGLRNLRSLELSSNRISSIEEDSFSELTELKTISLRANEIGRINSTLFKNNKNLTSIRLEDNPNLILPDQIFANLEELTNIILKNTNTKDIPNGLFKNLKKLTTLDLSSNQIHSLPDDVFSDLTTLKTLTLDNNNITYISKDLLKSTKELRTLNVKNNKIFDIQIEAFLSLKNLIKLDLSNNVYETNYTYDTTPFARCIALKSIILTHNSITKFPYSLLGMQNIEDISLNFNKIRTIEILEITSALSPNLQTIDVSNNEIQNVDFEGVELQTKLNMKELDAYHNTREQILLDLKNNPLVCDCRNYDLVRYIQSDMTPGVMAIVDIDVKEIECIKPDIFRGYKLTDLKPKDISCQINLIPCPENCECFWRPYTDSIEVDCANRNMTRFPKLQITNTKVLMNLDGNYIRGGLEPGLGYENVTVLILSNNKLQELKWIPHGIEVLKLDRNELTHISTELFQVMNKTVNLTTIQLSDNPWTCGCSALELQIFIKGHYKKINPKDVVCKEDHMLLIEKTELCRPSTALILFTVLPVLSFLLLTVVGLILYIYYRQEVKVWLFSKNLCLWFVTEEEIDEDKLYDIFISYSNKDEEFVTQNLLPVLESGPRPFKTCIHVRDWEPGEMILTHVANSVMNSRRTLVVLSNNFLDSVWGIQEFKTAHTQAVKEGRARVIVVKYGELDDSRLDEDIKAYLNTNTYVEWGKPWFWNKLKYALPHFYQKGFYAANQKHANIMLKIDDKFELTEPPIKHPESTPPVILNPALLNDHPLNFRKANGMQISHSETPLVDKA